MTAPLRLLSELATIQTGIPFLASSDLDGGEPVFMPWALRGDDELRSDPSMVQRAKLLTSPEDKYRLRPQDILITAKATPGNIRCGYLSADWEPPWLFAANLIRVHADCGKIHPRFLHAWFCHPEGRAALIGSSQSTTGQLNLTASSIADVMIPVPSWQDQMKAVELLHIAAIAHHHAIAAAETRLTLAREIAFRPNKMSPNESPRLRIQSPNAGDEILSTEKGDGTWQPNAWLNDDVRQALENLPDRDLLELLDPSSNEFRYRSPAEFASRLITVLSEFLISCENHEFDLIRTLGRDPAIIVSDELAEKLGIKNGKRFVSSFLGELHPIQRPSGTNEQPT